MKKTLQDFSYIYYAGVIILSQSSRWRDLSDLIGRMGCVLIVMFSCYDDKQTLRSREISMLTLHW